MKTFITICIALSLFGPTVAKWMTYADCMYKLSADYHICDCSQILRSDITNTNKETTTSKVKDINIKPDWTISRTVAISNVSFSLILEPIYNTYSVTIPRAPSFILLKPPCLHG